MPNLPAVLMIGVAVAALSACDRKDEAAVPPERTGTPEAAPATPQAAAPVLQTRSETRQFRDWSASCGNDGACWAFGFAPEFGAGWVRIALQPGPDARPEIDFGYWPDENAKGDRIALVIDARTYPATRSGDPEAPIGAIRTDAAAVIAAMVQGKTATIRGGSSQIVSLNGAAAALLWIDEKQGRLNTPTALIRRGDQPASSVPVAPPLPVVAPAPAANQAGFGDEGQTVPAPLRARTEVGTCLKESQNPAVADMVISARLDARTELWGVPCGAGAYNVTHNWYVTGPGGRNPRPVDLVGTGGAGRGVDQPDNSTVNGAYDPGSRTLSAFAKGRGIGDCGVSQSWVWTGDRFTLSAESVMGECAGVPSDYWPTTWRSRPG